MSIFQRLHQFRIIRTFCNAKTWHLRFPDIADTKEAVVERWLKKEGDSFTTRDTICEVSLFPSDIMVGVNDSRSGFIAKLLVPVGKRLTVNDPIALLVSDKEELNSYLDKQREEFLDEEVLKETVKIMDESKKPPDMKSLLRHIKDMIQSGDIQEGSEFAKRLQSCARKGNKELLSIYEASFEAGNHTMEAFDKSFFLENANDIVKEIAEQEVTEKVQSTQ